MTQNNKINKNWRNQQKTTNSMGKCGKIEKITKIQELKKILNLGSSGTLKKLINIHRKTRAPHLPSNFHHHFEIEKSKNQILRKLKN